MNIELINYSKQRVVSSLFLKKWIQNIYKELKKRKIKTSELNKHLTVVFLTPREIKKLNFQFRKKNKVTDVLSFPSHDQNHLGEIALCPPYIKKQAQKSHLSLRSYWAYIVLHGILHLLGFDHEKSKLKAREMFQLQDQIFEKLQTTIN